MKVNRLHLPETMNVMCTNFVVIHWVDWNISQDKLKLLSYLILYRAWGNHSHLINSLETMNVCAEDKDKRGGLTDWHVLYIHSCSCNLVAWYSLHTNNFTNTTLSHPSFQNFLNPFRQCYPAFFPKHVGIGLGPPVIVNGWMAVRMEGWATTIKCKNKLGQYVFYWTNT